MTVSLGDVDVSRALGYLKRLSSKVVSSATLIELPSGVKRGNIVNSFQPPMQIVALTTIEPDVTVLAHVHRPVHPSPLVSSRRSALDGRTAGLCGFAG